MHDLIEKIHDASYYHPKILCLIGDTFINSPVNEPIIIDTECLEAIGTYLICKLKQQKYVIDEQIIEKIALYKRWDVTEIVNGQFITHETKDNDHYRQIIDYRLKQLLSQSSPVIVIIQIILNVIHLSELDTFGHTLAMTLLKQKIEQMEVSEALSTLIEELDIHDLMLKNEQIDELQTTIQNPAISCAIIIVRAINDTFKVDQNTLNVINNQSVTDWKQFNLEHIKEYNDMVIKEMEKSGLYNKLHLYVEHMENTTKAVVSMLRKFCSHNDSLDEPQVTKLVTHIDTLLTLIESKIYHINKIFNTVNKLYNDLKQDSLNIVSIELIAVIEQNYEKIANLKKQFDQYKNDLVEYKDQITTLREALRYCSSETHQKLAIQYRIFEQQFSTAQQAMPIVMHEIQLGYKHVKVHAHSILDKDDDTNQGINTQQEPKIDKRIAGIEFRDVQKCISKVDDLYEQFNFAKSKFNRAETAYSLMKIYIDDLLGVEPLHCEQVIKTFNFAVQSYQRLLQTQKDCLSRTDIGTEIECLRCKLQEKSNRLMGLIEQKSNVSSNNCNSSPLSKEIQNPICSSNISPEEKTSRVKRGPLALFGTFKTASEESPRKKNSSKNASEVVANNYINPANNN